MNQKQTLLARGVCFLASEDLALAVPGTLLLDVTASLPDVLEKLLKEMRAEDLANTDRLLLSLKRKCLGDEGY